MEDIVDNIGRLLRVERVLAHLVVDHIRALPHAAEREHERRDEVPNGTRDDVDYDDKFDVWTAVETIKHQCDAYLDRPRNHKANNVLRVVVLEVYLVSSLGRGEVHYD